MTALRALLTLVLLSLAMPALAQGTNVSFGTIRQDPNAEVEVTADNLSVDQATGTAVFSGNVVIGQGEMRLSAARVLVVYKGSGNGIDRLEATGGVTLVSGPDAAEAERADYNIDRGTIEMSGNVLLTQGPSALTADRMSVDLNDGSARMSGRVKTILQTGNN
ncbi:MAG: LptA/OstA family protein [Pseudomonadota bacterium]